MNKNEYNHKPESIKNPFSEPFDAERTANNFYEQFLKGNPFFMEYAPSLSAQDSGKKSFHPQRDNGGAKNENKQVIVISYSKDADNVSPMNVTVEYPNGGKYHDDDEAALCAAVGIVLSNSIGKNQLIDANAICKYMVKSMTEMLGKIILAASIFKKK